MFLGGTRKYRRIIEDKKRNINRDFNQYWDEKDNSKLRDELYLEGRFLQEKRAQGLINKGPGEGFRMVRYVYVLPAWRLIFENLPEDEDQVNPDHKHYHLKHALKTYHREFIKNTYVKQNSPAFVAYQHKHRNDHEKLFQAWDIYLDIFRDPNRVDELRDNNYPIEVFHEADKEFERRIKALEEEASAP